MSPGGRPAFGGTKSPPPWGSHKVNSAPDGCRIVEICDWNTGEVRRRDESRRCRHERQSTLRAVSSARNQRLLDTFARMEAARQAKADITLEFDTRTRAWPRFLPIPCIDGGVRPLAKRVTSLESLVLLSEPGRANNSRRYNPWTRSVLSNSACKLFNRKDKPHETFEVVSGECPRATSGVAKLFLRVSLVSTRQARVPASRPYGRQCEVIFASALRPWGRASCLQVLWCHTSGNRVLS